MPEFLVEIWSRYENLFWLMAIVSVVTLVLSIVLVPILIVLLPADFYAERNHRRRLFEDRPMLRALFLLFKNALGAVLFVAVVFGLINFPCVSCWTLLGQQLQRLLTSQRRLVAFNVGMASLLVLSLYPVLLP